MAPTTKLRSRESKKRLKPKPKKDKKSWQTRNAARLPKQEAHLALKLAAEAAATATLSDIEVS